MQLEYNGFVSLLPTLSLLAAWAALGLLRSRDVLAEALDNPSRYLQWGLMFGAVLTLLEATTTLPVFDLVRLVHNALNIEITQLSGAPVTPITIATVLVVVFGSWWISTLARDGLARVMLNRSIGDEGSIGVLAELLGPGQMSHCVVEHQQKMLDSIAHRGPPPRNGTAAWRSIPSLPSAS